MMEKNIGRTKSKEKSKQQFLDAVGTILQTKGYKYLKVNEIAATAGLDKKLIYNYFGGTEQLLDEYIQSQDFWSKVEPEGLTALMSDGGKTFSKQMLSQQFEVVAQNKALQKILLWRLAEERASLRKITDQQEENGEILLKIVTDGMTEEKAKNFRAVMAVLISGIYYLNLYSEVNGSVFCGLNIKKETDRTHIKKALDFLVNQTFETL